MPAGPDAPLVFAPLFRERVWGGRALAERLGKALPEGAPIGESWELVDRADAQSVVAGGPLAGRSLQELWSTEREAVFGTRAAAVGERFPLLIKLLDARETLSLQVHPRPEEAESSDASGAGVDAFGPELDERDARARTLGPVADVGDAEAKTEMWLVVGAAPGAHVYAGLRSNVTRESFCAALLAGHDVSALLHRIEVHVGDALFLPSGRVHAIGAGCLMVEVQQSSDTTYRVYDFDRPGLDGRPRELHVKQAMRSIDWTDVEPRPIDARRPGTVVACPWFTVTRRRLDGDGAAVATAGECAAVIVLNGTVRCAERRFVPGELFLVPAADAGAPVAAVDAPVDTMDADAPAVATRRAWSADVLVVELPD